MINFYKHLLIYFICFVLSLFGLSAINLNKYLKQGKVAQAYCLYWIVAACMAYLLGQFLMSVIYKLQ